MTEKLTPLDSLQIIEEMINKAKNNFAENGFLYLLWGWVIFVCAIVHFILIKINFLVHPESVWALTWLTIIFQIFYLSKNKNKEKVKNYTDDIVGFIWMSFGICMGLTAFILAKADCCFLLYSLFMMLYGIPTFLAGAVMQFKPLKIGGICCWVLSIVSTFISFQNVLLLFALAVVIAWIIPGYLLRKKYLLENINDARI